MRRKGRRQPSPTIDAPHVRVIATRVHDACEMQRRDDGASIVIAWKADCLTKPERQVRQRLCEGSSYPTHWAITRTSHDLASRLHLQIETI